MIFSLKISPRNTWCDTADELVIKGMCSIRDLLNGDVLFPVKAHEDHLVAYLRVGYGTDIYHHLVHTDPAENGASDA